MADKFELDEARARELIAEIAEEEWEQEVDELALSDVNDNWARAVHELLYLIFDGGDEYGEGALRGPAGATISAYPVDWEGDANVLITVRMRDNTALPQTAYPYAVEVRKMAHVFDTKGEALFIALCWSAIAYANELLPHLLTLSEAHTKLQHDEEE